MQEACNFFFFTFLMTFEIMVCIILSNTEGNLVWLIILFFTLTIWAFYNLLDLCPL